MKRTKTLNDLYPPGKSYVFCEKCDNWVQVDTVISRKNAKDLTRYYCPSHDNPPAQAAQ